MNPPDYPWLHPNPHTVLWRIKHEDIDHYNHVNNVAYLKQLEAVSWSHTHALGLTIDDYKALDRGMVITRHEIDYHAAALLDDTLLCATWVLHCDNKLFLQRQFQIVDQHSGKQLLTATTHYACIALSSGKPKRMPAIFAQTYGSVALTLPSGTSTGNTR